MRKTELFFDSIADDFAERENPFDLQARKQWFDSALSKYPAKDALIVDVGTGLGHFSRIAQRHGAQVIPLDIAPRLIARLRETIPTAMVGSAVTLPFGTETIDMVVSSECIEHTPDPRRAVAEMLRVLRPGGMLFLSTPNLVWRWSIGVAEFLRIRRFEGIENWLSRSALRNALVQNGGEIIETTGLHILPFQLTPLRPLIRYVNQNGQALRGVMINQCWIVRKVRTVSPGR